MASFFSASLAHQFKKAVFVCGFLFLSTPLQADPGPESPFLGFSGHWSGSGTITMTDGTAERIRCRASYSVYETGRALQQTLRCASESYRLEISSNVMSAGGSLSGSWSEATRGVSGSISGRASGSEIVANVVGGSFTARLDVHTHGDRQSVSIRPQGTDVAAVSITLHKG
ncbi:MAG TPA: hypothetical protein VL996_09465 [Methylocella sp.]|nr:hypothetical protein [Methylocella sp.]